MFSYFFLSTERRRLKRTIWQTQRGFICQWSWCHGTAVVLSIAEGGARAGIQSLFDSCHLWIFDLFSSNKPNTHQPRRTIRSSFNFILQYIITFRRRSMHTFNQHMVSCHLMETSSFAMSLLSSIVMSCPSRWSNTGQESTLIVIGILDVHL